MFPNLWERIEGWFPDLTAAEWNRVQVSLLLIIFMLIFLIQAVLIYLRNMKGEKIKTWDPLAISLFCSNFVFALVFILTSIGVIWPEAGLQPDWAKILERSLGILFGLWAIFMLIREGWPDPISQSGEGSAPSE